MKTVVAKLILGVPVTLGIGMAFGLKDHTPVSEQKEIIEQVIDSIEPIKDTIFYPLVSGNEGGHWPRAIVSTKSYLSTPRYDQLA